MAHLVPSLSFLKCFRSELEQGLSVHVAIRNSIDSEETDFAKQIMLWKAQVERGERDNLTQSFRSHYQKCFLEILFSGLNGAPVYEHLKLLEVEMEGEFERQWKAYLEKLPFKLSIPLLLCFFPAYIILLFGPLITQFLSEVS